MFRGGFNWNLEFRWYAVPPKMSSQRIDDPSAPIASPTMAGGLFSIDRLYFEELGTYDTGFDIWVSLFHSNFNYLYRAEKISKFHSEFGCAAGN